jgi:uncharacterized membrane-anchored protein
MLRILVVILVFFLSIQVSLFNELQAQEERSLSENEQNIVNALAEMNEEDREKTIEFFSLDWKDVGIYKFERSNSTISVPEGYHLLIGEEAHKALTIMGEPKREYMEAVLYDENFENTILFNYDECGFVSIDDLDEINAKQLLETIIENTEKTNEKRRKNGVNEIHVVGWLQEPTLDKNTNTVFWAIEAIEDNEPIVNSIAIKLGRKGVAAIIWVASKDIYVHFGGHLDVMLRAHSFDAGFQYKDYKSGDNVAGYGIAALVAATAGGKIVKAGGIAVIFKKLWSVIFAAVAGIFYKLKKLFKRKDNSI